MAGEKAELASFRVWPQRDANKEVDEDVREQDVKSRSHPGRAPTQSSFPEVGFFRAASQLLRNENGREPDDEDADMETPCGLAERLGETEERTPVNDHTCYEPRQS